MVEIQKNFNLLVKKQEEIVNKISSLSLKDVDKMNQQMAKFSTTLTSLVNDNTKIVEELFNIKEIVSTLRDLKSDLSDYDEESYNGMLRYFGALN